MSRNNKKRKMKQQQRRAEQQRAQERLEREPAAETKENIGKGQQQLENEHKASHSQGSTDTIRQALDSKIPEFSGEGAGDSKRSAVRSEQPSESEKSTSSSDVLQRTTEALRKAGRRSRQWTVLILSAGAGIWGGLYKLASGWRNNVDSRLEQNAYTYQHDPIPGQGGTCEQLTPLVSAALPSGSGFMMRMLHGTYVVDKLPPFCRELAFSRATDFNMRTWASGSEQIFWWVAAASAVAVSGHMLVSFCAKPSLVPTPSDSSFVDPIAVLDEKGSADWKAVRSGLSKAGMLPAGASEEKIRKIISDKLLANEAWRTFLMGMHPKNVKGMDGKTPSSVYTLSKDTLFAPAAMGFVKDFLGVSDMPLQDTPRPGVDNEEEKGDQKRIA